MSNILSCDLIDAIKTGRIGIIADVDGSLTPPGNHPQLLNYNDILVRAHDATHGAFMFLTNNDGRSVDRVVKLIRRNEFTAIGHADAAEHFKTSIRRPEFQFPIVSECATQIRRWEKGVEIIEKAHDNLSLDVSAITQYLRSDEQTARIVDRTLNDGRLQYQAKENTVCFNFEEGDEEAKRNLQALCTRICQEQGLGAYEVVTLIDSVEIVPKDAHKKNVLEFLDKFSAFKDKDFILMIGDTETDADVARELHASGRGAMIAVGKNVKDGDHVIQRVETIDELMTVLDHIALQVEANKKINFGPKIIQGRSGLSVPKAPSRGVSGPV